MFAFLLCSIIEPTYRFGKSWNYTLFALECSLKWFFTFGFSTLKIKRETCCFNFRKIVDHVDWMTSPEQVADAVKRFRYVFYHDVKCEVLTNWCLISICLPILLTWGNYYHSPEYQLDHTLLFTYIKWEKAIVTWRRLFLSFLVYLRNFFVNQSIRARVQVYLEMSYHCSDVVSWLPWWRHVHALPLKANKLVLREPKLWVYPSTLDGYNGTEVWIWNYQRLCLSISVKF